MRKLPFVFIIVPCYNVENCVKRCIDSLIANTYQNKRIILVDDGSTDGTASILRDFDNNYDCVSLVQKKYNNGLGMARNSGLDFAQGGEYVIFVDSDDYTSPTLVETAVCAIEQSGCDLCEFGFNNEKGETWIPQVYHYKS